METRRYITVEEDPFFALFSLSHFLEFYSHSTVTKKLAEILIQIISTHITYTKSERKIKCRKEEKINNWRANVFDVFGSCDVSVIVIKRPTMS